MIKHGDPDYSHLLGQQQRQLEAELHANGRLRAIYIAVLILPVLAFVTLVGLLIFRFLGGTQ